MKLKIRILAIILGVTLTSYAQINLKFGPVVDMGLASYSTKGDSVTLDGGISPAFGITAEQFFNYRFSLRGTSLYSFKSLNTTRVNRNEKDKMNGQFLDFSLVGRYSGYDEDVRILPYGIAGLGIAFNIVSKSQENHMIGTTYNSTLPYFIVGIGAGYKMSFFSQIDLSFNYQRFLVPMFTIPIDNKDARLNQFSLRITGLF
jgi:hypothetical protein